MAYVVRPTPTPPSTQRQSTVVASPRPAPAPSATPSPSDWNAQWNQVWNDYWNKGFNQQFGQVSYGGSGQFSSAQSQGYAAGLAERQRRSQTTTRTGTPTPTPTPTPQAPGQPTYDYDAEARAREQEVESLFGGGMDILNQMLQSTQANYPNLEAGAVAPYEAQRPGIEEQATNALGSNLDIQQAEKSREANAISSARRLYNELNQANVQRFGGSSSAGEFSSQLLGRELMRNIGNVQNTSGTNIRNLMLQAQQIETSKQAALTALTKEIEGAKARARTEFQARIDAINQSRAGLEQNKAVAKLDALRELRNRINSIEDTNVAYQRQINLLHEQARTPINNILQNLGSVTSSQVPLTTPAQAQFSTPGSYALGQATPSIYGFLNPSRRWDYSQGAPGQTLG